MCVLYYDLWELHVSDIMSLGLCETIVNSASLLWTAQFIIIHEERGGPLPNEGTQNSYKYTTLIDDNYLFS